MLMICVGYVEEDNICASLEYYAAHITGWFISNKLQSFVDKSQNTSCN